MNKKSPKRSMGDRNVFKNLLKAKYLLPICTALVIPVFSSFSSVEAENTGSSDMDYAVLTTEVVPGTDEVVPAEVTPETGDGEISEQPQPVEETSDLYLTDAVLNNALLIYGLANETNNYDPNANYNEYNFDREDWKLILINKSHSIPDGYEVPLGTIYGSWLCDKRVVPDLLLMLRDARSAGTGLYVASPYRTSSLQVSLYNNKITKFMNTGMSYLEAYKLAGQAVTIPGTSEHEAGLCIDFLCDSYKSLSEGFEDTKAGKWLAENAHKYGFILRYPKDKEYITTIEYEPWHFRYVGVEAATVMYEEGITLEEFWEIYLD